MRQQFKGVLGMIAIKHPGDCRVIKKLLHYDHSSQHSYTAGHSGHQHETEDYLGRHTWQNKLGANKGRGKYQAPGVGMKHGHNGKYGGAGRQGCCINHGHRQGVQVLGSVRVQHPLVRASISAKDCACEP